MRIYQLNHPETVPVWLPQWLSESELRSFFKPAIISASSSLLLKRGEGYFLDWGDNFLSLRMGVFTCRWVLQGNSWQPSCSCSFPSPYCVHSWAAAFLLKDISYQKGWLEKPQQQFSAKPTIRASDHRAKRQAVLNFANNNTAQASSSVQKLKLEVELDFKHEPGTASIRFYVVENSERNIVRLGNLYSYAADLLNENRKHLRSWNEKDASFLKWLIQSLRKHYPANRNFLMMKISEQEFLRWRKRWREQTDRFIERYSQKNILPPGENVPAKLIVEINEQTTKYQLTPFFVFPNGQKKQPYQLIRELANDPNKNQRQKELLSFKPAIPWTQLNKYFGGPKKTFIEKKQAQKKLQEILLGRFDLLTGKIIRKTSKTLDSVELFADFLQGNFILFGKIFNNRIPLNEAIAPVSNLVIKPNEIIIEIKQVGEITLLLQEKLKKFAAENSADVLPNYLSLRGTKNNAQKIKDFWASLPATIQKTAGESVKYLFDETANVIEAELDVKSTGAFVDFSIAWKLQNEKISSADFLPALQGNSSLIRSSSGKWFSLDKQRCLELLDKLRNSYFEGEESFSVLKQDAKSNIEQIIDSKLFTLSDRTTRSYNRFAIEPKKKLPEIPESLQNILRDYQKEGSNFLINRCFYGAGCLLADDMGLGKTLQVLTVLLAFHNAKEAALTQSSLIVCPAGVMNVWQEQCERFCPELKAVLWQGNKENREKIFAEGNYDLLITHYGMIRQEFELLQNGNFDFIILDEAQAIKNPAAQVSKAVKALNSNYRIALTGTPMENKLLDLWSIMDFLNKGIFGDADSFQDLYTVSPIALKKKLQLLMIRRNKSKVAAELPERIVEIMPIELGEEQREAYDLTLLRTREKMQEFGAMQILAGLTRLRQICCDPSLYLKSANTIESTKLEILLEKLSELLDAGHSVLVFSQFTQMLAIIAERLNNLELPYWKITGETALQKRTEAVKEFNSSNEAAVFLLSLKAAGTGLTLTKADYVFLYDPWWNPAVENQAIDRTHRIGQDKTVVAYRMMAKNTVEERVIKLMQEKEKLFNEIVGESEETVASKKLTREELLNLLV